MLKTSVVICTYNGQEYLKRQLDSVAHQVVGANEVVIVDDASTDGSWSIICNFREAHPHMNLRIYKNEGNLGFVANFVGAASLASNEIIFFCDQDDIWRPDKIQKSINKFIADPALTCLHSNARIIDVNSHDTGDNLFSVLKITQAELNKMALFSYFEVLLRRNVVTGATMAVRRSAFLKTLPIPSGWIHDDWIPLVNSLIGKVAYESELLIDYRVHPGNTIGLGSGRIKNIFSDKLTILDSYRLRIQKLQRLQGRCFGEKEQQQYLEGYIAYMQYRVDIASRSFGKRLLLVMVKFIDGTYKKFGRGLKSAARDLFSF